MSRVRLIMLWGFIWYLFCAYGCSPAPRQASEQKDKKSIVNVKKVQESALQAASATAEKTIIEKVENKQIILPSAKAEPAGIQEQGQEVVSVAAIQKKELLDYDCRQIGLIEQDECLLCEEIPGAACFPTSRDSLGIQCYECVEKMVSCREIGLLEDNECDFCDEISGAVCSASKMTKQGRQCFECMEFTQEVSIPAAEEVQELVVITLEEVPEPDMADLQKEIAAVKEDILNLGETFVTERINKDETVIEKPLVVLKDDSVELQNSKEPFEEVLPLEAVEPVLEPEPLPDEIDPMVIHEETGIKQDIIVEVMADCSEMGLLSEAACTQCSLCLTVDVAENGQECFRCMDQLAKNSQSSCLESNHFDSCSSCGENTECKEINVINFYNNYSSPMITCYDCSAVTENQENVVVTLNK